MPRFIAVHTMPGTEEEVKKLAREMPSQLPPGVSWKLTYCAFGDNKFFCEWEAPNRRQSSKSSRRATCLSAQSTRYGYSTSLRQRLRHEKSSRSRGIK